MDEVKKAVEIFEKYGIKTQVDNNNMIIISHYEQPKGTTFKELGVDENELIKNVIACEGKFDTRKSALTSFPLVAAREIRLDKDTKIVEMPNLKAVGVLLVNEHLKKLPKFIPPTTGYYRTGNLAFAFSSLRSLTSFPENYFSFLAPINNPSYSAKDCSYMLSSCYKLKSLPNDFNTKIIDQYGGSYYYSMYNRQPLYGAFSSLMSLIEIRNLHIPPITGNIDSNLFQKTFSNCMSLKHLTFLPDYILTWKSQVIDLSSNVGYGTGKATVENYNTLQILDKLKEVKDDATYQALKNTDDWWSQDIAYSCYNKASAVETINSLPDTSAYLATAGGTNTIKFKGEAGSATDGGAIYTMTEEEIAVATAKGWTVSFV